MAEKIEPERQPYKERSLAIAIPLLVVIVIAVGLTTRLFASTLDRNSASAVIGPSEINDGIAAQATVTGVDPLKREMEIRLALEPVGSLNHDGLLSRPVVLYYSSVDGTKQIDFKKDKPLGNTDLTVPLLGDSVASYPWDQYSGDIELNFVTVSDAQPTTAPTSTTTTPTTTTPTTPDGAVGPAAEPKPAEPKPAETPPAIKLDTLVPASLMVFENVPAYNVLEVSGKDTNGVISAKFALRRAPTAIFFSLLVTAIMWALALGVMFIALSVILRRRELEVAHISMMAVILFAMPAALRGFQPGIPPPGVLSDFYGFFWCDVIVAMSLVSVVTVYVRRGPG